MDFLFGDRLGREVYTCAEYSFIGLIWSLNDIGFEFGVLDFEGSVRDWCELMTVVLIVFCLIRRNKWSFSVTVSYSVLKFLSKFFFNGLLLRLGVPFVFKIVSWKQCFHLRLKSLCDSV